MNSALFETVLRKTYRLYGQKDGSKVPSLLTDDDTPVVALFIAARREMGVEFLTMEPETLWLSMEISDYNKQKLQAALTMATRPAFYWSPRVYSLSVALFNNQHAQADILAPCEPEEMAWASVCATLLYGVTSDTEDEPYYDDEVAALVAVNLHDRGIVKAPTQLEFAQDELDRLLTPEGLELQAKVKSLETTDSKAEDPIEEPSALRVQQDHLSRVDEYLNAQLQVLETTLGKL